MSDITQLSDEDLKAAASAQSSQPDISQLSDDDLKAAASKTGPLEGFVRGLGRAATTFADLPRAVPPPYIGTPYSGYQVGPTGNLIQLGTPGSVAPPVPPIPTLTQQYNKTFGPPTPFQWNNPSTYPETLGSAGGALLAPAAGKLAEGATGLGGLAANYAIPGAVTSIGFGSAERAAQGQPTTPADVAVEGVAGGIMNTVGGPLIEKAIDTGIPLIGKTIRNVFSPKPTEKINLDVPAAEQAATVPATAPTTQPKGSFLNKRFKNQGPQPTEPIGSADLGNESPSPLKGTVREQAGQLRKRTGSLNERLRNVVDTKLRLDQIEHNLEAAYDVLAQRIRNRDKVNINRKKPVVIDPIERRTMREAAAKKAGLSKNQLKADDRNYIDLIRQAGTALQKWNPNNKIMSDKQLTGEVGKYLLLQKAAKKAYEDAKTVAKLEEVIPSKTHIEVTYKGHTYLVSNVANKGRYRPHGTPQQNKIFEAEYSRLLRNAEAIKRKINTEFEPELKKLIGYLEYKDPKMAKAIKGVQALKTADVTAAIERAGLTQTYVNVLTGLISNDSNIQRALSVGAIVAGQAMGGPAQAATDEKEQERNFFNVGGALTLIGIAGLAGPKVAQSVAGKQAASLTAHALHYVSDKYYVPALKAAEAAAASLGIKTTAPEVANTVNRLIGSVFLSRSNLDIIERNADVAFLKAFQTAKLAYRKATGGTDLFPANATVQQTQAALKALYASSAAEIESLPLSVSQKKIFVEMFYAKKRVADICRAEEKRLSPSRNPSKAQDSGVYGNKALAATIRLEREMNWDATSPYQRSAAADVLNLAAHGVTQAVQLGNLAMHGYHKVEQWGSVGSRYGIEMVRAEGLIISRDKNALAFCRANNVTMPLTSQVVDTETPITGKIAMWQESVLKKVLGEETYNKILNFKPGQVIRRQGSGKGIESWKTDVSLVTGSEKAAGVLDYPGGGANLRADITHWLNREPEKCSSNFSEEKGYAALGIIYDDVLDHCIGADAIGLRVNLTVDRWAQGTGGAAKIVMPFVRTAAIANRARYLLAQTFIDGMASGDLQKAGAALGAFVMTYGISAAWQGHAAIEKETEQYMMDNHPLELVKLHKAMARLNIVGQIPGATGYVLNKVGIKNEFEKNNFVLTHTQPTFWWTSRLSTPIPLETGKAIIDIGNAKTNDRTKMRDSTYLAGQVGMGSIGDTISLAQGLKLMTAFTDSRDRGGHVDWSYSPHWPLNLDALIPEGQESYGREKSHYLNQHLEQQGNPVLAAAVAFFRPGESIASEEKIFNDQVEYSCQRLLKREFPEQTLDYFTAVLEHACPVKQYYDHIYRKISLHTATEQEKAMYGDVKTRLLSLEKEENEPIVPIFPGLMVKPKEFWQAAYKRCQDNPQVAKQLNPDMAIPGWAHKHHRPYAQ